jgi:hypothetical protein
MTQSAHPDTLCASCRDSKANMKKELRCGLCQNFVCKDCAHPLKRLTFSFFKKIPDELSRDIYCEQCHNDTVAPALENYEKIMAQAKDVFIFEKTANSIPLIMRSKQKMTVSDCPDRKETILRLAFFAAERSFNAVVDVELTATKIRNYGYQTSSWSGFGFPARIRISAERERF